MTKKVIGGIFFALAVLSLIGSAVNGTLLDSPGALLGSLIPVALYAFSGLFLFSFDNVYQLNFIEGFKVRNKQCTKIIIFIAIYAFLSFVGGGVSGMESVRSNAGVILLLFKNVIPYFIPAIVFAAMLGIYCTGYMGCKRHFRIDDAALNTYLSPNETFQSYNHENTVLASDKVLFLTKSFCIIPLDKIASAKFVNLIVEKDINIYFTNGKKITITANEDTYNAIQNAINASK